MKTVSIVAAVLVAVAGNICAAEFANLQVMRAAEIKATAAQAAVPAMAALPSGRAETPLDGWLDGGYHDHEAPYPQNSAYKYVLYAMLVKAEGTLHLQAFAPGKLNYLASFKTTPEAALKNIGALRSDQGYPYIVAFSRSAHSAAVKTNMLVVQFNSKRQFRFAVTPAFPAADIENDKFKSYVPSDSDKGAWSPWMAVR